MFGFPWVELNGLRADQGHHNPTFQDHLPIPAHIRDDA